MMKMLLVIFGFLILNESIQAQKIKYSRMDSIAYDLEYTKFNIGKFKSQVTTGYIISSIGVLTMAVGNAMIAYPNDPNIVDPKEMSKKIDDYNTQRMIVNGLGGVLAVVGAVVVIDSYGWLRRASIKPSQYGVSFTIDIDSEKDTGY